MEYIKINDNIWIEYDPSSMTSGVIQIDKLQLEKNNLGVDLNNTPEIPENNVILEWGKQHYPYSENLNKRSGFLKRVKEIDDVLNIIKKQKQK